MASPVILDLRSSVSVALDDPHQFHADPRLIMHLSPPRRVLARVVHPACARIGGAPRASGSRRQSPLFLGAAEHRQPQPCPFTPEVARFVREVLASSSPRGVPECRFFLPHFPLLSLLLFFPFPSR